MPRAFCPECGSEVPVDADGVCHVGHQVDLGGATGGPTDARATGEDADEPQPWVASVDTTTLGGFTPPPGPPDAVPDEQPWTPDTGAGPSPAGGGDDLAAAAAAAVESLEAGDPGGTGTADGAGPDPVEATGDEVEAAWPHTLPAEGESGTPGWTPPTNDPVAPPPVPAPAPADPPAPVGTGGDDDLHGGDFDLDDLAAAVSELGMEEDGETAAPAATAASDVGPAGEPTTEIDWDDDLGEPTGPGGDRETVVVDSSSSGGPAEDVDLSNFTAKGGKVRTGEEGRKGGLFRRR